MSRVTMDTPFSMVPEWIIKAPVSAHAVRLYASIFRFANLPHGAMPGRTVLAEEWLHVSLDTLDRALRELTKIGALSKTSKAGKPNEYILYATPTNSRTRAAVKDTNSRTGAQGNSRTRAAQKRVGSRGTRSGGPAAAPRARTARDDIWDALVAATGIDPQTTNEKKRFGRSVTDLMEAGATALEIQVRWGRWAKKHKADVVAASTERVLVEHWGELAGRSRANANVDCPKCHEPFPSNQRLKEHMYDKHDIGHICPDCATVYGPNEEHACRQQSKR